MAAKFTIKPKYSQWAVDNGEPQRYKWTLVDTDGHDLMETPYQFRTIGDARVSISAVKKAAGKFTKVEVENAE